MIIYRDIFEGKVLSTEDFDSGEANVKIASLDEIQDFIDAGFKPDEKFLYLRVIAMGSGEYYGCNKNGDYFPEAELIAHHKTFETAGLHKEHVNKPDSPKYGYVAKAYYNLKMHRVELLLAIDKAKAPDVVAMVARGEVPEVSMGCKIKHDVCSICGNIAKTKVDYCDHIRMQNKRVLPDGRQVYMINIRPLFHDISIVRRRADRIALTLSKVASETVMVAKKRMRNDFDQFFAESAVDKTAAEKKPVRKPDEAIQTVSNDELDPQAKEAAEKRAELLKRLKAEGVTPFATQGLAHYMQDMEDWEEPLPEHVLHRWASRHSLKDLLYSLLRNHIPLKPREFTRVIIIKHGLPEEHVPHIMRGMHMADEEGLDDIFDDSDYEPEIEREIRPYREKRSSAYPYVVDRFLEFMDSTQKVSMSLPSDVGTAAAFGLGSESGYGAWMYPVYPLEGQGRVQSVGHYFSPLEPSFYKPKVIPSNYAEPYASSANYGPARPTIPTDATIKERRRQLDALLSGDKSIVKGMNPATLGLILGALFLAYRGRAGLSVLSKTAKEDAVRYVDLTEKTAGEGNISKKILWKGVAPFLGVHLVGAHYRDKMMRGEHVGRAGQFVADHSDVLSLAAPIATTVLTRKIAGESCEDILKDTDLAELKLASLGSMGASSVMAGLLFKGKSYGTAASIGEMALDNAAIGGAIAGGTWGVNKLLKAKKKRIGMHDDIQDSQTR